MPWRIPDTWSGTDSINSSSTTWNLGTKNLKSIMRITLIVALIAAVNAVMPPGVPVGSHDLSPHQAARMTAEEITIWNTARYNPSASQNAYNAPPSRFQAPKNEWGMFGPASIQGFQPPPPASSRPHQHHHQVTSHQSDEDALMTKALAESKAVYEQEERLRKEQKEQERRDEELARRLQEQLNVKNTQPQQFQRPPSFVPLAQTSEPQRFERPPSFVPSTQTSRPLRPTASRNKHALVISLDYSKSSSRLKGTHRDAKSMIRLLTDKGYGIQHLSDAWYVNDENYLPTRMNVIGAMTMLVQGMNAGDMRFLYFAGHGSQSPDTTGLEADGMSEYINLHEGDMLYDYEMYQILAHMVPPGAQLFAMFDACHSGTILNLPFTWRINSVDGQGIWRNEDGPDALNVLNEAKFHAKNANPYKFANALGRVGNVGYQQAMRMAGLASGGPSMPSTPHVIDPSLAVPIQFPPAGPLPGRVILLSGCKDCAVSNEQARLNGVVPDADDEGTITEGVFTAGFLNFLIELGQRQVTYHDMLVGVRRQVVQIRRGSQSQKPQMSTGSKTWDPRTSLFEI